MAKFNKPKRIQPFHIDDKLKGEKGRRGEGKVGGKPQFLAVKNCQMLCTTYSRLSLSLSLSALSLPVIRSSERRAIKWIVMYVRHHRTHSRMRGVRCARERWPKSSQMMNVTPRGEGCRSASITSNRHRWSETTRYGRRETADAAGG